MDEARQAVDRILSKDEAKRKERLEREFESKQRRMGLLRVPTLPKPRSRKPMPGQLGLFEP